MTPKQQKEHNNAVKFASDIVEFTRKHVPMATMKKEVWYQTEHGNIKKFAELLGVPQNLLTAMVAVTSPLQKWEQNVSWAVDIVRYCQGEDVNIKQGIARNANTAIDMYNIWVDTGEFTDEIADGFLGVKTGAFYHNLLYPTTSLRFTVDVWMNRIALKEWQSPTNTFKVSAGDKRSIANAYMMAWRELELDTVGVMPHMFQAALWLAIKQAKIASQWLTDFDSVERFV